MCRMHARQRGCGRIVPWIKAPLFNSVMPQSLRRTCPVGAVVQEGWLPFKRLQRSGQVRRKAPKGGTRAPIGLRCTTRQGQPALTFAARLANVRPSLR